VSGWQQPAAATWEQPPATPNVFNVKSYGARGDYVGVSGTDDTAAIQAAINACAAAKGGVVFFPSGRYYTRALTVAGSGITLEGVGIGDTTGGGFGTMLVGSSAMAAGDDLVTVSGVFCAIRQMALSGNGNGRDVLRLKNTASRFIGDSLRLQFGGAGNGITVGDSITSIPVKFTNIYVNNNGVHGALVNASDTEWANVETYHNTGDGFHIAGSAANVVNLHPWGNTAAGLNLSGAGNRITNLYSETNTGNGVDILSASGIYNTITGGVVRANAIGININTAAKRTTINGVKVYNNTAQGIFVQSGDYSQLADSDCFDDQGTKTQTYGIQIAAGVTGTAITGRVPIAGDNKTGGLNNAGTATMVNGAITVVLAADQVFNANVTLATILSAAVKAGGKWAIEGMLVVDGSQAADLRIRLNATGATGPVGYFGLGTAPAVSSASASAVSVLPLDAAPLISGAAVAQFGTIGVGSLQAIGLRGYFDAGTTDASLDLQVAQATSDATNTTIHAGSFLRVVQVG
jgi:hypothetical protein